MELQPVEGDLLALIYGNFEVARIDLMAEKFDSRNIYRLLQLQMILPDKLQTIWA